MALGQLDEGKRLGLGEDGTGRVVGITVEDGAAAGRETVLKGVKVKGEVVFFAQRGEARRAASHTHHLLVRRIAGRGENHLVARLREREQRSRNAFNGPAGNDDLAVGIIVHALAQQRLGDQLAQLRQARGQRILGARALGNLLLHESLDRLRGIKAGDPLSEGDHAGDAARRQLHFLDRREFH